MEFDHVLSVRCSVRRYTEEPVSEEDIQKIVKAGEEVPVGHFDFKNYAIAAITDKKVLRLLAEENQALSGRGDPIYGAPLLLLIMNTPEAREDSIKLNAGIMAENMHLKAVDLGLGSICILQLYPHAEPGRGIWKIFPGPAPAGGAEAGHGGGCGAYAHGSAGAAVCGKDSHLPY